MIKIFSAFCVRERLFLPAHVSLQGPPSLAFPAQPGRPPPSPPSQKHFTWFRNIYSVFHRLETGPCQAFHFPWTRIPTARLRFSSQMSPSTRNEHLLAGRTTLPTRNHAQLTPGHRHRSSSLPHASANTARLPGVQLIQDEASGTPGQGNKSWVSGGVIGQGSRAHWVATFLRPQICHHSGGTQRG